MRRREVRMESAIATQPIGAACAARGECGAGGSRIICVVDAWHAMLSDRPYRRAMSVEAAAAELRANAGSQFDPAVVSAFLDLQAP